MSISSIKSIVYMLKDMLPFNKIECGTHNVQNIVANVKMKNVSFIDLNAIYKDYSTDCTYQSTIFPGLIFRPKDSPVVLLIFNSCRFVVTGAKQYNDVVYGFQKILQSIKKYITFNDDSSHKIDVQSEVAGVLREFEIEK